MEPTNLVDPSPWIRQLFILLRPRLPRDFVGTIEVNVFKGGISNITIKQSYKENAT